MNFFVGYFKLKGTIENKSFVSDESIDPKTAHTVVATELAPIKTPRKSLLFEPPASF
jgi:hypothetical protein